MLKIREQDSQGAGHYGAPRGSRKHNGIDIVCHAGEVVTCFESGGVTKLGYPYNPNDDKKGHLRYVEVTVPNGDRHRYFYTGPLVDVGDSVERGQTIGSAQGLTEIYPGITDHYHFEIKLRDGSFIDPVPVLHELGYEVE